MKISINIEFIPNAGRDSGEIKFKTSDTVIAYIRGEQPTQAERVGALESALAKMNDKGCFHYVGENETIVVNDVWFYDPNFEQLNLLPKTSYVLLFCLDKIGIEYFTTGYGCYIGTLERFTHLADLNGMSVNHYCRIHGVEVTEDYVCGAIVDYEEKNGVYRG